MYVCVCETAGVVLPLPQHVSAKREQESVAQTGSGLQCLGLLEERSSWWQSLQQDSVKQSQVIHITQKRKW